MQPKHVAALDLLNKSCVLRDYVLIIACYYQLSTLCVCVCVCVCVFVCVHVYTGVFCITCSRLSPTI